MARILSGVMTALIGIMGVAEAADPAAKVTCTNPVNGWQWKIQINYTAATVDSFAAKISSGEISWHDPRDSGNYILDRNSGSLSAAFPSSTGGYIMQYRCALKGAQ